MTVTMRGSNVAIARWLRSGGGAEIRALLGPEQPYRVVRDARVSCRPRLEQGVVVFELCDDCAPSPAP